MKRYDLHKHSWMEEALNGDYILYEDHRRALEEIESFPRWIDDAERTGDMDPDLRIRLIREADGDVIISIVRDRVGPIADVQFCTVGSGGGQSPNVHRALCALMVAIEADSKARPIVEPRE